MMPLAKQLDACAPVYAPCLYICTSTCSQATLVPSKLPRSSCLPLQGVKKACVSTSEVIICIAWAQVEVLKTPTTTNGEACGQPVSCKHNISRAVNSAAAASGRQPLSDLSRNICPFRPAQPPSLQQPSGLQSAPANTGKCPFAASSQTTQQHLAHQDSSEHQASALSTKNSLPASEPLLSTAGHAAGTPGMVAESASAGGVDLAAVEAELDSFADTFAIHPDEALLHAYASLLADKVAEADSTSPSSDICIAAPKAVGASETSALLDAVGSDRCAAAKSALNSPAYASLLADKVAEEESTSPSSETYVAAPKAVDASEASRYREAAGCGQCIEAMTALGSPAVSGMQKQQSDCASDRGHSTGPSFTQEQNKGTRSENQGKSQFISRQKQQNHVKMPAHEQSTGGSLPSSSKQSLRGAETQLPDYTDDTSGFGEGATGQAMAVPAGCWDQLLLVWDSWWGWMGQHTYTWRALMVACFGAQLLMAAYFGLVHQRCAPHIA